MRSDISLIVMAAGRAERFRKSGGANLANLGGANLGGGAACGEAFGGAAFGGRGGAKICKKTWLRIEGETFGQFGGESRESLGESCESCGESTPLWLFVADSLHQRYGFKKVVITAEAREVGYMRGFCDYEIVAGGETRQDSLKNALALVDSAFVAVCDAARFDLDFGVLDAMFGENLGEDSRDFDCLVPTVGVNDTIFVEDVEGGAAALNSGANPANLGVGRDLAGGAANPCGAANPAPQKTYLKRENIHLVQTPQISRVSVLLEALKLGDFSDESSAINALTGRVKTIRGSKKMQKLTTMADLAGFRLHFSREIRTGSGFDVHRFAPGRELWLCGVRIPCDVGLEAHSDGDVALHALCDAILGGIGAGDIGEWFPPENEKYRNIDSKILLAEVVDFALSVGFKIINVDLTLMAQKPKILPFKTQMQRVLSEILGLSKNRVNLKATTMEGLGFVGRSEGICASASVNLAPIIITKCNKRI